MSKKTNTPKTVADKKATDLNVKVETPTVDKATENNELVMEANITPETETPETETNPLPAPEPEKRIVSSTVVLTNCTANTICITNGNIKITVAPREIKKVSRDDLKELLKQKMIQRYFDKGVLTHNLEADEVSASDAEVPDELKGAVERHEDGLTISASVKTFEADGSVKLEL